MLGHMVCRFLKKNKDCNIYTTSLRWPHDAFKKYIINFYNVEKGDYLINCIGAIHQKTEMFNINTDLPIWLDENIDLGLSQCKIIHPGTDCEFDNDEYGKSKRLASEYIINKGKASKVIRTSIIGPELKTKVSLLDWFLNSRNCVDGYTQTMWNGITTLQWAKICNDLILNWDSYQTLTVPYTKCISKYELLLNIKDVYNKNIIIDKNSNIKVNKCLDGNMKSPNIKEQLKEMKFFYNED